MVRPPDFKPEEITSPIQLLAVWLAGLFFLVATLLAAAVEIDDPAWLAPVLVIGALGVIVLFAVLVFLMLTKYRPESQADPYFSRYLELKAQDSFKNFAPENAEREVSIPTSGETGALESKRKSIYAETRELFLTHEWVPSEIAGQRADIIIKLVKHGSGGIKALPIKCVKYQLGPKFSDAPIERRDPNDGYELAISAYSPMACLAEVTFSDGSPPALLYRYVDF